MSKISVLLCVYNPDREQLYRAVESIVRQTCTDWEMIVYDDGSDAACASMIEEIARLDGRIRYVRNEMHHSLAYGLNASLQLAAGEYIARMDADDISEPERLQKQLWFLEHNPQYMWVGSNIAVIDEDGIQWDERNYPAMPQKEDFLKYSPYAHPTVMIRRCELLQCGGYGRGEKACRGEDYELLMRLHAAGRQGYNLQECLLQYRETEQSYSRRKLRFQVQEVGIRFRGFREMGVFTPKTCIYVIKPILVWLIPGKIKHALRKRQSQFGRTAVESG